MTSNKIPKLSEMQQRALGKLTYEWQSAYRLQESLATLDALHSRGLAERFYDRDAGFFPRNGIKYRKAALPLQGEKHDQS